MGRRALPSTMMKEAIDERDVEKFGWAILEQSRLDLSNHGENKTYTTTDVLSAMRQIVILQKDKRIEDNGDATSDTKDSLEQWIKQPGAKGKTL